MGEGERVIAIWLQREHRLLGTKPRSLVYSFTGPAPGPRPPALHFIYNTLLLLLKQSLREHQPSLLTHTPRPPSLGVGGLTGLRPLPPAPKTKTHPENKF